MLSARDYFRFSIQGHLEDPLGQGRGLEDSITGCTVVLASRTGSQPPNFVAVTLEWAKASVLVLSLLSLEHCVRPPIMIIIIMFV